MKINGIEVTKKQFTTYFKKKAKKRKAEIKFSKTYLGQQMELRK